MPRVRRAELIPAFANRVFALPSRLDARTLPSAAPKGSLLKRPGRENLSHFRTVRTLLEPEHRRAKMSPASIRKTREETAE
jgi:hypothetical protein